MRQQVRAYLQKAAEQADAIPFFKALLKKYSQVLVQIEIAPHGDHIFSYQPDSKVQLHLALCKTYQQDDYRNIAPLLSETEARIPIAHCYVSLALVIYEQVKQARQQQTDEDQKALDQCPDSYEAIIAKKVHVDIDQLWEYTAAEKEAQQAAKAIHKLLIWGRAGIGKSVLCKNIVSEWQQQQLFQAKFDHIFLIRLCTIPPELLAKQPQASLLAWLICDQFFGSIRKKPDLPSLQAYLEAEGEKILWVLDGYDEIADSLAKSPPWITFSKDASWSPGLSLLPVP